MVYLIVSLAKGRMYVKEIHRWSPEKTFVVYYDTPPIKEYRKDLDDALKQLPTKLEDLGPYERIGYKSPNVVETARGLLKIIDAHPDKKFIINWTEGLKTGLVASLLVASIRRKQIEGVYLLYSTREGDYLMTRLPIVQLKLTDSQINILRQIEGGEKIGHRIAKGCGLKKTRVYDLIKRLQEDGYLTKEKELTDTAKVALLGAEGT